MNYRGSQWKFLNNAKIFSNANDAVDYIHQLYNKNIKITLDAFAEFDKTSKITSKNHATYPYVGIEVSVNDLHVDPSLSYGVVAEAGSYGTTITAPALFDHYYREQLGLLIKRHRIPIIVGESQWSIPLPFIVEHTKAQFDVNQFARLHHNFVWPDLKRINDDIANARYIIPENGIRPLALFSGERVDFSLQRLHHYTGTAPKHFQSFVVLTNYHRYVEEFIEYSKQAIMNNPDDLELIAPGDVVIFDKSGLKNDLPKHLPQMPAYHLKKANGDGITFINIGVGPSNAKNITDHLSVLRPHCWLMLGHCAGLRTNQYLGDYVLAHGYVREDHVLDQDLPPWISIPPIAEVQVALQQAIMNVVGMDEHDIKTQVRTGTVLTTDNRNWELMTNELSERFKQSRTIAVDMESATVAANGFRFRVPYGTLLCVSDKPIHGVIKLQGMANEFYRKRVSQHLKIGLEAIQILRQHGTSQLHSRKLRGFDECPFR